MASDADDCVLYSIVHHWPSSNHTRAIPATSCLPAIRRTDGNTESECNQ